MKFDIEDNEIRIIGKTMSDSLNSIGDSMSDSKRESNNKKPKKHLWFWILALILLLFILGMCIAKCHKKTQPTFEYTTAQVDDTTNVVNYEISEKNKAYTIVECDTVNDISLHIYTPVSGKAKLYVGVLPLDDKKIFLAAQAADYRADNGKISGAFVYKGELLSRGHPKYGFCAIIGDQMTMGMGRETTLFERAIEQDGYFFRQFSLIHESQFGESTPKGKAIRRALCYRDKQVYIIESDEPESMHDFTQALIDIGIQEAIALVGRICMPIYEDKDGNRHVNEINHKENIQETYIIWEK